MTNLEDHFGDNAELSGELHQEISQFLQQTSAESSSAPLSKKITRRTSNSTPIRISEIGFIKHEHDEINFKRLKDIDSLANCEKCHQSAAKGIYDENDIQINGRRYDD